MAASSMRHHMGITHGRVFPHVMGVDVGGGGIEVYKVSFPWILDLVDCLVDKFPAKAKTPGRLRGQFMFFHCKSKVAILQEGPKPLPRCD